MRLNQLEMAFEGKALRDRDVAAGALMVKNQAPQSARRRHAHHAKGAPVTRPARAEGDDSPKVLVEINELSAARGTPPLGEPSDVD
jgi:hypothetical protein